MNNHTRKLGGVLAPILTIFCFVSLFSCRAKQDCRGESLTTVEVACDSFDVGCMSVGDTIQVSFVLKNTGGIPLYIEDVVPSCDCITAGFSREKVAIGDSTEIKLKYKAEGSSGYLFRTADVVCNSDSPIELIITGFIGV